MKYATKAIHGGIMTQREINGVNVPLELSTTFLQPNLHEFKDFMYARGNNPTRYYAETLVAQLENAKYALGTSSGMAATSMVFGLFKQGDFIITNSNVYGGTYRYVSQLLGQSGIGYKMVDDFAILTKEDFEKATAIFIETPSNPLLDVYDINRLAQLAKQTGTLLIVDNTFMTSYLQKPLSLGADIVVYSATKYYGGHSDVIGGFVITNNDDLYTRLKFLQNTFGGIMSPFDSYMIQRGIKTMALRLDQSCRNTQQIADYLNKNEAIKKVYYPGLKSHPQYALQKQQAKHAGAVLSFILTDDYDTDLFASSLKIIGLAVSLGGVESLICHPATMTHESFPIELQEEIGISQGLLRLAVGIEDIDDLIADIEQALQKAKKEKEK